VRAHGASLLSGDPYDDALVQTVRPADWTNPAPASRYHLVVIGAGTAGLVTAAAAAGLGARVALVEQHLMGGDCLNVGCVPSKAIIGASRAWHVGAGAAARFAGPSVTGQGDFGSVMERMRRLRSGIAPVDGAERFRSLGVDVFLGRAEFQSGDALRVGDASLRFRRAVIATGARAAVPPVPGLADADYHTNESIFTLTRRPERMVVLGGGPIGCELAQAFQRLGVSVTLLQDAERILPRDDVETSAVVAASLEADGVRIETAVRVIDVTRGPDGSVMRYATASATSTAAPALLLVATGRAPNVEGLGLERAGVEFTERGVTVDNNLRTSNRRIFAAGDVCSPYRFTHAADAQARLVVQNALFPGRRKASVLVIPWATYTDPEVAQVGLTEQDAQTSGHKVDVIRVGLEHVDRAILDGRTDGFVKILLAPGSDRILGATVVAPHAGDLISEVAVAMTNGLGLGALGRTVHPYPTVAEAFRKAADQWQRRKLTPLAKRLLAGWFRLTA
jgi:pyruvate/2-oxoglutarate dehydrogenase complex dihydrolipoamide dehydrogenase (E3) component